MFIDKETLIVVLVFSILGIAGFRSYYLQQIRQWHSMYSEINDKYREASKELSAYHKKNITQKK